MAPSPKMLAVKPAGATQPVRTVAHPALPFKPAPEGAKSIRDLFYEQECEAFLTRFYDNTRSPSDRIKDAMGISACIPWIGNEDLVEECLLTLSETMQDDSEHPSLRMACSIAIGSSGAKGLVSRIEGILKSDASVSSKILALRALSIARTKEALQLLSTAAKYADVDEVCFAAAKELASIPLFQARREAESILNAPPEAYARHPEFASVLRRILDGSPLN